jgi:hypothetical protein
VGEISDIVLGGVDTFSLISKAMDVASLAKTLDKDSDLFKLLGFGLRTEDEVVAASDATEEVISTEALATRGKLGSCVAKAQDTALQCATTTFKGFAMDTLGLGSALTSVARRSLPRRAEAAMNLTTSLERRWPSEQLLKARAKPQETCLFNVKASRH